MNFTKKSSKSKNMLMTLLLLISFLQGYYIMKNNDIIEHISLQEFKGKTDYNKINIIDNRIVIAEKDNNEYYKIIIPNWEYFDSNIDTTVPIYFDKSFDWSAYIGGFIYVLIMCLIISVMKKNMNGFKSIMTIDKSIEIMNHIKTRFTDVIGQNNAKRSIEEFVDILKNRDKYLKLGVKVPRGALLSGPPGTGKTLIAKAIAGECNLPFISMVGSEFNAMFVGVGSSKIKNLYESAKIAANEYGGCIIFIDEIDAIGQKRSSMSSYGGNSERENTLNQLLTELDGFDSNQNVITFVATNRPELLDHALLRPGRFDRKISMDLPTIKERTELFNFYLNKLSLKEKTVSNISKTSSKLTPGFSGADIANVVNESGIIAVRHKKTTVDEDDIKSAIDYVMMGSEKDDILTEKEKFVVAYHESGHALLSCILPSVENPLKVSIIPREKGMLGFSQSEVSEEHLYSKKKMEELIIVLMGGRVCEEYFCGDVTNGASNDIEKATDIARNYVKRYGFSFSNKFMNYNDENPYKNETSNFLCDDADKEIRELLNKKYEETQFLVNENKDNIERIKNKLLEKETIYYKDIKRIIYK